MFKRKTREPMDRLQIVEYQRLVDYRIKLAGWLNFLFSMFLILVAIWTPHSNQISSTAVVFFFISVVFAAWYAIRNS